ncbi:MAG: S8 family serine peptidase [Cyclobacteriaceae bacterium]|nr:S8 family serine peptidase [Cyclobacteriaceae bacterium HetDA_MAG_MS6]
MLRGALKLAFLLLFVIGSAGQDKYWVYDYDAQSNLISTDPLFCSQWLDACSFSLKAGEIQSLQNNGIDILPVLSFDQKSSPNSLSAKDVGFALEQIEGKLFAEKGLTGKGVKIGIIDGGFLKANKDPTLSHLFENNQVKVYKDFITPDLPAYGGIAGLDDVHGTEVWQLIGGWNRAKEIQFGLATESEYYLARTDHGAYEKRIEEDYLIQALEWMESLDIRLVNISLGYAKNYTNPKENYTPQQMDGKTSAIARAVDIATYEKDMLIVVAAGNEASDSKWRVLSTPGDAEGALTVGASKLSIWDKMNYSSIGTPSLPYLKPNISCFAADGTSFATPVITGIAACLMQLHPHLSAIQIKSIIEKSGHFYPYGNNYLGYGVPKASTVLVIAAGAEESIERPKSIKKKRAYTLQGPFDQPYVVAFHKKNDYEVIEREVYRPEKNKIKIKQKELASQTSILFDNQVVEVFWEK